jgi:hypothetical protein
VRPYLLKTENIQSARALIKKHLEYRTTLVPFHGIELQGKPGRPYDVKEAALQPLDDLDTFLLSRLLLLWLLLLLLNMSLLLRVSLPVGHVFSQQSDELLRFGPAADKVEGRTEMEFN